MISSAHITQCEKVFLFLLAGKKRKEINLYVLLIDFNIYSES